MTERSIDSVLDPRHNSLNLVRLALAMTVLFAHSYTLSGNGLGFLFNNEHLGTWAVYCFFCLSGFLITGSRLRTKWADYLTHRLARIYPAFFVSLVVVAFGFAPIAYFKQHGTIDGFLTTAPTPLHHIAANWPLNMLKGEWGVAGTIATNPHASSWNGSLWSLYFEFICYLLIGVLLTVSFLRKHPILLVGFWLASVVALGRAADTLAYFGGNGEVGLLLRLLPWFMGGAAVYALRHRIPLTWWTALPAFAAFIALVRWDGVWGPPLSAPLLTLFLLWLGHVLPSPSLIRHHDISYGCYIYAFPSQQMVTFLGGAEWGPTVHALLSVPSTVLLAIASWLIIERPAMRAVRGKKPGHNEGDLAQADPAQADPAQADQAPTDHEQPQGASLSVDQPEAARR